MRKRNPIARVVTRIHHKVIPDKRRIIREKTLDELIKETHMPETINDMIENMRGMTDDSPERLSLASFLLGLTVGSLWGAKKHLEEIQRLAKASGNAKIYNEATIAIKKYADLNREP